MQHLQVSIKEQKVSEEFRLLHESKICEHFYCCIYILKHQPAAFGKNSIGNDELGKYGFDKKNKIYIRETRTSFLFKTLTTNKHW